MLDRGLIAGRLFVNQRVVVRRRGHPLANSRSLRDLVDADWIMTGASQPGESEYEKQFTSLGLPFPRAVTHTITALPIVALLSSTDAIAFLPHQWVRNPLFSTTLTEIPIVEPLAGREMVRLMRRGVPLTAIDEQSRYLFEQESLAVKG